MGEPKTPKFDSLRSRYLTEDDFMLRLVDTVPHKYYFDADTVEALTEEINEKVADKAQGLTKRAHKMARLDPALYQTVSQLLQAVRGSSKKAARRKAKASLHSAALDRASNLDELKQRLSHKIQELRGKRPTGKRKATKRAAKSAAKPNQSKRPKPVQESIVPNAGKKKKAAKPQPAPAVFNRDGLMVFSKFELADTAVGAEPKPQARPGKNKKQQLVRQLENQQEKMRSLEERDPNLAQQAKKKQQWNRALDRAQGLKVRDDPELLKASLKRHEKRRQQSRKKWQARTETVQQRQEERQQKRRNNIKARKQAKLQGKMKRLKKKGRLVAGF